MPIMKFQFLMVQKLLPRLKFNAKDTQTGHKQNRESTKG